MEALGQFFDPRLACFAYVGDEPVGFAIMTPDFNQVLHKAYARPGVPEPITLIKAFWHWKIRPKIDWLRTPLLGVKAEHHGKGVDLVMFDFLMKAVAKTNYKHVDSGWVLETNEPTLRAGFSMGMNIYKTYRFYETPITSK